MDRKDIPGFRHQSQNNPVAPYSTAVIELVPAVLDDDAVVQ
jgi:hypothetical protein